MQPVLIESGRLHSSPYHCLVFGGVECLLPSCYSQTINHAEGNCKLSSTEFIPCISVWSPVIWPPSTPAPCPQPSLKSQFDPFSLTLLASWRSEDSRGVPFWAWPIAPKRCPPVLPIWLRTIGSHLFPGCAALHGVSVPLFLCPRVVGGGFFLAVMHSAFGLFSGNISEALTVC